MEDSVHPEAATSVVDVESQNFKAPDAVPVLKRNPKPAATDLSSPVSADNETEDDRKQISSSNQQKTVSLDYTEPNWSKPLESSDYSFEVLKNGVVVDVIKFVPGKSKWIIGRLPEVCDIACEHPSCSRFHAVLQYGRNTTDSTDGFYLCDLESTHGTLVNKRKLNPLEYIRLEPGYVLKFGASTRFYVFNGPENDTDDITEPVTQPPAVAPKKEEDTGVDWGFGPDAVDEDKEEEVGFLDSAPVGLDEYYKDDPKKALNSFFTREGVDFTYDCEEVGHGHKKQFLCRIPLPLETPNGRQMIAEATVGGKKKDALAAAILEACRILHAKGVLKGTTQIGKKHKSKNWADEDYYDSDEDTYLDRTGDVEKKRQQRINRSGKKDVAAETYDTLTAKLQDVQKELAELSEKLKSADLIKSESIGDGGLDALDTFMDAIKAGKIMDPKSRLKLKQRITDLTHEEAKLKRLIKIAEPAFSSTAFTTAVSLTAIKSEEKEHVEETGKVHIGRLKAVPIPAAPIFDHSAPKFEEEKEEDEEDQKSEIKVEPVEEPGDVSAPIQEIVAGETAPVGAEVKLQLDDKRSEIPDDGRKVQSHPLTPRDSQPSQQPAKKRKLTKRKEAEVEYDAENPDYVMWIPPEDLPEETADVAKRFGY